MYTDVEVERLVALRSEPGGAGGAVHPLPGAGAVPAAGPFVKVLAHREPGDGPGNARPWCCKPSQVAWRLGGAR